MVHVRPEPRNDSDGEYHLKITADLGDTNSTAEKTNEFLGNLFPAGSPLEYAKHTVQPDGVVLVSFLTNKASFSEAAARFCEAVFAAPAKESRILTKRGVLGLEPAEHSEVFRQQWYTAMFRAAGIELMETLDATSQDDDLPDWALALLFCVVAQVNTGFMTSNLQEPFSPETVEYAKTFLLKYVDKHGGGTAALPSSELQRTFSEVVCALHSTSDRPSGPPGAELIIPLYTAAHAAARVLVAKRGIFLEFLRRRQIAANTLKNGNVFLRASAIAQDSISGLLSDDTSNELCSPKLVEETPAPDAPIHPAWWVAAPLVLPFVIAGVIFYGPYAAARWVGSQREEAKLAEVNELALFVARAFGLALDCGVMLRWFVWSEPKEGFVGVQQRAECGKLLGNGTRITEVLTHLSRQGKELKIWRDELGVLKR